MTAYNYDSEKKQVFRCDKILSLSTNENIPPVDNNRLESLKKNNFKEKNATDFEINITEKGVDLFIKENYPSMTSFGVTIHRLSRDTIIKMKKILSQITFLFLEKKLFQSSHLN